MTLSRDARLLLACLHQSQNPLDEHIAGDSPDWQQVMTLAREHRVRPLLQRRLQDTGYWQRVDAEAWQRLLHECRVVTARKVRLHAELDQIVAALARARIPVILMKGAHLGPAIYRNIALREMDDLDIMVAREHLGAAVALMIERGYEGIREFSVEADAEIANHATGLVKRDVAALEIHWNITYPNAATAIDAAPLWHRAQPVTEVAAPALGLSAADLLLHVCYHASYHHQFEIGLRPYCDIAEIAAGWNGDDNWREVVRIAIEHRWSRGVALTLQLARDFVGARVPDWVVSRLAPSDLHERVPAACAVVWSTPGEIAAFERRLAPLSAGTPWRTSLAAVRRSFLLPKAELVALYPSAASSDWWRLFYVRRFSELIRRYGLDALRLRRDRSGTLTAVAHRRNELTNWLSARN
jgi:hypothetical protein